MISQRFSRCLFGPGEGVLGSEMCQDLSVPLLLLERGLPVLMSTGKVLCWEKQLSQELVSVCAWAGEIIQLLPSGLGNVHWDGPFKKNRGF